MKTMDEADNGCDINWLGFSLSPRMKMEATHNHPHQHHHHGHNQYNDHSQTGLYISSSQLSGTGICYAVGENGGFHSQLSVMPLKSDGSLCIMEALTRSQSSVSEGMPHNSSSSSSRKFEDFLGGAAMEAHGRETMPLTLDMSMYYQNNSDPNDQTNRQEEIHSYYTGLACQSVYQPHPLGTETNDTQLRVHSESENIHPLGQDQMLRLTNLVSGHYNGQAGNMVRRGLMDGGGNMGSMGCGELQSLSLSMSPGSQSSSVTVPRRISSNGSGDQCMAMEPKKRVCGKVGQKPTVHRKSIETFGQRTSQYRGVTRHRWTGRYEAHLWDNSCKKEGQTRKGRQVYLGGYDMEAKAARAYDLAALKYWGPSTHINFPLENYQDELEEMKNMTRQEYVAHLRRKSSGFSRGASMYRGVTRHHQHGRWQARIGRVAGNKDLYLGTFSTQEEAAEAYDVAAIKFRGVHAVTNFDITRYDVEKIMASNTLLAGELARRSKDLEENLQPMNYTSQLVQQHVNVEAIQPEKSLPSISGSASAEWKPFHDEMSYRNSAFAIELDSMIGGPESLDSSQSQAMDESAKIVTHLSKPSSLVTSLSSSREASPDKSGSNTVMMFDKNSLSSKFTNSSASWFHPPAEIRAQPAVTMAHLPVFAAWSET